MVERYTLKDNEAAIVFSPESVSCVVPDFEDEDTIVPQHIMEAVYLFILYRKDREKIEPFLKEIREEACKIEKEQNNEENNN